MAETAVRRSLARAFVGHDFEALRPADTREHPAASGCQRAQLVACPLADIDHHHHVAESSGCPLPDCG